ncbi:hypothetical protein SNE40_000857 [Patella caerulea]|uniref:Mutator-like transposase domain-containing protein n=1 Tax=Patella caerulea TaxID=87958 RepID=A0AAN8K5Y8_PATCE
MWIGAFIVQFHCTTSDQNNTRPNPNNEKTVHIVDHDEQNSSDSSVYDSNEINSTNNYNDDNNNDKQTTPISASKRKLQDYKQILVSLGLESFEDEDENNEPDAGFFFIQKSLLSQLVKNLKCPDCDLEELTVQITDPEINIEGLMDLTLTFDASWVARGHSSLYCVAFAIEIITCLVLDFHVVSSFSHSCTYAKNRFGADTHEFFNWFESHKSECNINFHGSSNAMEAEAARVIWSRSLESGFRYVG